MPGVGGNLQDHLQLRLIYQDPQYPHLEPDGQQPLWGKMGHGPALLLRPQRSTGHGAKPAGRLVRSSTDQATANPYHVQPLSLERFGEPLHQFLAFTASVCNRARQPWAYRYLQHWT